MYFASITIFPQLDLYILHLSCRLCTWHKYISWGYSMLVCTMCVWAAHICFVYFLCVCLLYYFSLCVFCMYASYFVFVHDNDVWFVLQCMLIHECGHFMVPRPKILWKDNFLWPRPYVWFASIFYPPKYVPPTPCHEIQHHLPQRRRREAKRLCAWHGIPCSHLGILVTRN